LTDGQGRTADFKNTVIILTSNLGSQFIAQLKPGAKVEDARSDVMDVVRASFKPEFLNRLDEIILFNRLEEKHMSKIVSIQLLRLEELLKEKNITLQMDDKAKSLLAKQGYDPIYGARPLKRVIQQNIQNALAEKILSGELNDGDNIKISAKDECFEFTA